MCGICGYTGRVDRAVLQRMTETLAHRGPDDSGLWIGEGIGLGVRRLSIIDVAGGHQPMTNEDGSVAVAFNGEIYNHRELRHRLEHHGHRFRTQADTETLVHLYEEFGDACVHLIQGMFGFALWDSTKRRLLLARDRLGIKPVYYAESGGSLIFGSEAKALLVHPSVKTRIDYQALDLYLSLRYVPGTNSLLADIKRLGPGHVLVFENGRSEVRRYWELVLGDYQPAVNLDEAVEEFAIRLRETVRAHLISDVPVGVLLSGGLDSSAVTALMATTSSRKVASFTVGFALPGAHNELDEARAVASHFGTDHHELVIKPDAADLLPGLIWHFDEPVADPSALPTYLICRFAREHVPVVLTGEGGDELLAGYPRYVWFSRAREIGRYVPRRFREGVLLPLARLTPLNTRYRRALDNVLAERDDVTRQLHWVNGVTPAIKSELLSHDLLNEIQPLGAETVLSRYLGQAGSQGVVNQLMELDVHTWLVDDVLAKMDRMSMAASVEARVPFLDHRLVEFVASLPSEVKVANLGTKTLLKRAMARVLPPATIRRRKHAFQIPLDQWVGGPLRGFVKDTLLDARARQRGWFNMSRVESLLAQNGVAGSAEGQSIWTLLCLELWSKTYLDRTQ